MLKSGLCMSIRFLLIGFSCIVIRIVQSFLIRLVLWLSSALNAQVLYLFYECRLVTGSAMTYMHVIVILEEASVVW